MLRSARLEWLIETWARFKALEITMDFEPLEVVSTYLKTFDSLGTLRNDALNVIAEV